MSTPCQAKTSKGLACKNKAKNGSFCFSHSHSPVLVNETSEKSKISIKVKTKTSSSSGEEPNRDRIGSTDGWIETDPIIEKTKTSISAGEKPNPTQPTVIGLAQLMVGLRPTQLSKRPKRASPLVKSPTQPTVIGLAQLMVGISNHMSSKSPKAMTVYKSWSGSLTIVLIHAETLPISIRMMNRNR